jgi:hypothetical protein
MSRPGWCRPAPCCARAFERPRVMMADVIQDRRVTEPAPGLTHPAFVDGSRLYWALPSPVHEGLGVRAVRPTGYKVMRCSPHASSRPSSRITTSCRSLRDPSSRPLNVRAVLAALKAWPGNAGACRHGRATASLDCSCARRTESIAGRDEETASGQTKKLAQGRLSHGPAVI